MPAERIDAISFEAELYKEWSSSSKTQDLGKYACTMELFKISDYKFCIEWVAEPLDPTHLQEDEVVEYGIWTEMNKGQLTLIDYDGGFSLPHQAVELLRKNNIVVPSDFE